MGREPAAKASDARRRVVRGRRPDCFVAVVELETGPVARLTANFYVQHEEKQHGMQFHGDRGSVLLSTWQDFDADVGLRPTAARRESIAYDRPAERGID